MKNLLKGFLIGIGKIIPGVSGAILAITLGVYDKSIEYINNFKNQKKESIKYLAPLVVGIVISIILFSKFLTFLFAKYYLVTMLFFIGLVIGGLPTVINKVNKKDYLIVIIVFILVFLLSITNIDNNYLIQNNFLDIIVMLISGLLEAIGTVVPGVSSSALLMIMGTYNLIISSVGNIMNITNLINNLKIIIPFLFGLLLGIIMIIKVLAYLLKKYENKVYSFVLGVLLSSIVLLIIKAFNSTFTFIQLIIGIILLVFGIFISNMFEK